MHFPMTMLALAATLLPTTTVAAPVADALAEYPSESNVHDGALERRGPSGYVEVWNKCSFNVYFQQVAQQGNVGTVTFLPANTKTGLYYQASMDGVSLKACKGTTTCSNPYQFEYTYDGDNGLVYYDLSAVNGDPFVAVNRRVYPSDGSGPTYHCNAGDTSNDCQFTNPTNGPVGAASANAILTFQLCN